ncbi:MAG: hypothetical protein COU08_02110 [Candidatus Harrisonbacteria bacterium CG10_big_fil_rev_8_21_14_0_10_42_17]|uniref:CopG-like ribbon-helix-helix domain-containing protein n=1 Tax=Candidatus Harrisonbacteria bacterium CG10_big_fil_rev_8_21_14_0_10_42_17 TaxID=1974584 RepID=A0A2M6WI60_9BACT|nr:MAG: hypothetical protein COU08_02110 [Candidatus Harrisonbacteria bacterium CG10_big_fil_rev_8_21_14_0_10_42_17]
MATTKKRLNVTLSPKVEKVIQKLAKRDNIPQATKLSQLITIALEIEEDTEWDKLAQKRDTKSAKFVPHSKAWK